MIWISLCFAVGFCLCIRILEDLRAKKLINSAAMTKIGTIFLLWSLALLFVFPKFNFYSVLMLYSPLVLLQFSEKWIHQRRELEFRAQFVSFLSSLILQMKAGKGFRESLKLSQQDRSKVFREKLEQMAQIVVFSQHYNRKSMSAFHIQVLDEFIQIDRSAHAAIKRLENFRRKLEIEDDFRRRSGQILLQLRIQSLIMVGLFLALLTFVIWNYQISELKHIIFISITLFCSGVGLAFILGRKIRWKV